MPFAEAVSFPRPLRRIVNPRMKKIRDDVLDSKGSRCPFRCIVHRHWTERPTAGHRARRKRLSSGRSVEGGARSLCARVRIDETGDGGARERCGRGPLVAHGCQRSNKVPPIVRAEHGQRFIHPDYHGSCFWPQPKSHDSCPQRVRSRASQALPQEPRALAAQRDLQR